MPSALPMRNKFREVNLLTLVKSHRVVGQLAEIKEKRKKSNETLFVQNVALS